MPQSRFTLDCTVVILLLFLTQLATGYVTVVNDYGPWDQYDGDNGAWQIDTTTTTTTTTTYLPNTRYLAKATRHKMKMKRRGMVQMGSSTSDSEMASKHAMDKKLTTKQSETTSSKKKKHTKTSESMKMIDSSSSSMKDSEKSQGKGMMGMMKGMMNGGGTSNPTMAPSPPPSASVAPTSAAPTTLAPTTTAPTSAEPTQSPVSTGVPTERPSIPTSQSDFCFDVDNERCGPDSWPDLDIENNQCGGSRNSPVTLTTLDVCEPVDYVFDVSCRLIDETSQLPHVALTHRRYSIISHFVNLFLFLLQGGTCTFGDLEYTVNEFKISALYPSSCTPPTVLVGDLKYQVESWDFALDTGHSIDGFATFGAVEVVVRMNFCQLVVLASRIHTGANTSHF